MKPAAASSRDRLAADAERCVKCALCLPHCPTYSLKGEEGDSPRGRIALIQALAEGTLAPTDDALGHLDGCLTCRACEAVCPAGVPYGRLIDGARAELAAHARPPPGVRALEFAARHPTSFARLAPLLRFAAALPLPRALAARRSYLRALRRLPRLAAGPPAGRPLALFLGCVARALDGEAIAASARLLGAAGYRVTVPAGQTCCGALALHGGRRRTALRLARRNVAALGEWPLIASCATGCTAQLIEYGALLPAAAGFAGRVHDATELLADALADGRLRPRSAAPLRVVLHTPCTQRNVLRSDAGRRALAALPGIDVRELPPGCCGAAGSQVLARPHDADALREPLLGKIRALDPDCVVTANVGCRLHLADGLGAQGPEVLHFATFLARRVAAADAEDNRVP